MSGACAPESKGQAVALRLESDTTHAAVAKELGIAPDRCPHGSGRPRGPTKARRQRFPARGGAPQVQKGERPPEGGERDPFKGKRLLCDEGGLAAKKAEFGFVGQHAHEWPVSAIASPWDNAPAESPMGAIERERAQGGLRGKGAGPTRDIRVHRGVLQQAAPPLGARIHGPGQLRGQDGWRKRRRGCCIEGKRPVNENGVDSPCCAGSPLFGTARYPSSLTAFGNRLCKNAIRSLLFSVLVF